MRPWQLARRVLQALPGAIMIVIVAFVLVHAAPGDPVLAIAGEHGDAAYYAFMRERFGLDTPLPRRLVTYLGRVFQGDFGESYVHGRPVISIIAERIPATLLLTASALLLSVVGGVPLGVAAARRAGRRGDAVITTAALALHASPAFWVAQLAIVGFAFHLGWFPVQGMETAGGAVGIGGVGDMLHHLVLPALVLAAQQLAAIVRLTRSGLVVEFWSDHVRTARSKGLSDRAVTWRHALPRALLPVVTIVGARVGHLLAGAVIVEAVFGWPGLGRLLLDALQSRDTPILLGLFFVVSLAVIVSNVLTDVAHAAMDPRVGHT
ncbi:MAG: ABC transporter permease [Gemmatimonadales bacterium]|nr:ABC transporter permease [Gemmatimonadales bacterium]